MNRKLLLIPVALLVFMFTGCANKVSPVGGPDDKTGPTVRQTTPAHKAVMVSTDAKITITFSEWLHSNSGKGISIYPETPLKVKISANRLEIRPLTRLKDSTTYHLVITSTLKDLHNNSMNAPASITFSTGATLDSGKISGCVVDPQRPFLQPCVVLFGAPWGAEDSGYCGQPDYLAQTDSAGTFSFENIRTGSYRLLAFIDKNSDSRLQSSTEELYTPIDSTILVTAADNRVILYPSSFDTSRQSIATISPMDNKTLVGYWKKPWDTIVCPALPHFSIGPVDSSGKSALLPVKLRLRAASTRFMLGIDSSLDSATYRLIYSIKSIFDSTEVFDTLRIDGSGRADTSKPFLKESTPKKQADLFPEIRLVWSEPVILADTFTMADTLGDTVLVIGDTAASDTTLLHATRPLLAGREYGFVIFTTQGKDLSGNPLSSRDSTDTATVVSISTVRADSIAVSLSGALPCLQPDPQRVWMFRPLNDKGHVVTCRDKGNSFRFDSLAASRGRIGTFIDRNGNNRPDAGSLLPFRSPEPFVMFDDTVEARARWDVEGVELSPCNPCERRTIAEAADSSEIREMK